jgi:ABC-2 type transport system ATP-binding protein
MPRPILEVVDVHKRYGRTIALNGVTVQVAAGEMFGLLGPNGAGKTTLLSIVSCLLAPDAGELRILGRKVTRSDRELRHHVGIVPQELAIYGQLTARENLTFFGELYGLSGASLRTRVNEVLDAIGLADRADDPANEFSGGMKRRLNFGAGLVHRPELLLLDEPTVGVDPQSRNHIFEEVRRINAAGVTVIYTSHYMEEVQGLCPRVGIMDQGHLIACDTVPALLQHLGGRIRLRVAERNAALRERLGGLPDVALLDHPGASAAEDGCTFELSCHDVKGTLLRLVGVLRDLGAEATDLETEEPNLERVFLRLTGRALRD